MPPKIWRSSFEWEDFAEHVSAIRGYPIEKSSIWCIAVDCETLDLGKEEKSAEEVFNILEAADNVEMDISVDNVLEAEDSDPFDFTVFFVDLKLTIHFSHMIQLDCREPDLNSTGIGVFTMNAVKQSNATEAL